MKDVSFLREQEQTFVSLTCETSREGRKVRQGELASAEHSQCPAAHPGALPSTWHEGGIPVLAPGL